MTKLKLLISVGTATTALVPLAMLISSSVNVVGPSLLSSGKLQNGIIRTGEGDRVSSNLVNQEGHYEGSREQLLETSSFSENTTDYLSAEKSQSARNQRQTNKSPIKPNKELTKEEMRAIKEKANLNDWLDIINPLINKEQNLTILTRWESWYFKLIQWDKDCQCFVFSDPEYGIWTNSAGSLTIGKKWENPHKNVVPATKNSKCNNFNGFWWQDWHTWNRLNSWLRSSENNKNEHKAIASCYKYPVTFLETDKYFPVFEKSRSGNISVNGPMNYYYNHLIGRFVRLEDWEEMPEHYTKVSSYYDWKRLWNINLVKK